jgi:GxxExxY protein
LEINEITGSVIGAAIEVHRTLGPGLLESTYEECLCQELTLQRIPFQHQQPLPIDYKGLSLDCGYRIDLLVADAVVVELKAAEKILPVSRGTATHLFEVRWMESGTNHQLQCAGSKARYSQARSES